MPTEYTYDYAIVRIVPRVERGERINVGVILSCVDETFLDCRLELDPERLRLLDPALDVESIRASLATIPLVCKGGPRGGRDRRPAAARPLPLAGVAAQHRDSDVAGAHGAHHESGGRARSSAGDDGAARGQRRVLGFRLELSPTPHAPSLKTTWPRRPRGRSPPRAPAGATATTSRPACSTTPARRRTPRGAVSSASASGGRRAGSFSRHASTSASTERGIGVEERADGGAGTVLT